MTEPWSAGENRERRLAAAILAAVVLFCLLAPKMSSLAKGYPPPVIRVKIGTLKKSTVVEAQGLSWKAGHRSAKAGEARLAWDGRNLRINGRGAGLPVRFTASGPISVDGTEFRGYLMISSGAPPLLLNFIDVESYVAGVINQEMDSRWPAAAVDAQAILARTYALKRAMERKGRSFDLDRTVADQVYGGVAAEDDLAWAAVERTRGMVLVFKGGLISGHYHSCCGGRTELPSEVWGGSDRPCQKSVVCRYCQGAPRYFWRFPERGTVSGKELAAAIGSPREVVEVEVTQRTGSGRARNVELRSANRTFRFTGQEFRKLMGYNVIFSTAIRVDREEGGFVFRGSGSGHGAGLCQWGAKGMAEAGFSSEAILGYYFPGSKPGPRGRMHIK
jgi:stage II sporulation protein D